MIKSEIKIGTVLTNSWNGMADYYEVIGVHGNLVKLREIDWGTCPAPAGEESDPVHRWTCLATNEDGSWKYRSEKVYAKKMMKGKNPDSVYITGIGYTGTRMYINEDPHKKTEMYWG